MSQGILLAIAAGSLRSGPSAPATPTGLSVSPASAPGGDSQLNASWSAATGSVQGYNVQWSTDDATWNALAQTANLYASITGLTDATLIYVQVQAYGPGGNSYWSASVTATTLADEIQQIQYVDANSNPITPISGTYDLVFGGQTTSGISYAAAQSDIGTALNTLSTINGDAGVSGSAPTFSCQFIGALGGAPQSLLTVAGNTLLAADNTISVTTISPFGDTGVTLSVSEITAGVNGINNVWSFNETNGPQGGMLQFNVDGFFAGGFGGGYPDSLAASDMQTAINSIVSGFTVAVVDATLSPTGSALPYAITFSDFASHTMSFDTDTNDCGATYMQSTPASAAIVEVMQITCTPAPNVGQYNIGSDLLNFDDSTGAGVVACQAAINDLLTGSGFTAAVTGGPLSSGAFTVTYSPAGVPALKLSDATSNFGTPNVINSTMATDVNQVDQIQLDANVSGGTGTLGADTFDWNDTGSGVQTAYNDFATANSYSAATIAQTSSSPNTFSVTYATAGDQTAVTAALLAAMNTANALTQAVTVSITETQAGG